MDNTPPDDILLLKQRLAEQEALVRTLQEKLSQREREIDHLQAQLDKLRRMNFGRQSEKMARRIAQMETDLKRLQQESDALTGRVDDPRFPDRYARPAHANRSRRHSLAMRNACRLQKRAAPTVVARCPTSARIRPNNWN